MRRLLPFLLMTALAIPTAGCVLVPTKPEKRSHAVKKKPKKGRACHPSQYWDGHKCRHKGKGKGARKHDG